MNALALLFSQPWVDRLGWTLIHFLWQGALTAALYAAARSWITRGSGANARYALACTTLAVMVVLPLVTFTSIQQSGSAQLSASVPQKTDSALSQATAASTLVSRQAGPVSWLTQLLPTVVLVWLSGAIVFWIRLAGGWLLATRLRSKSVRPAPAEWQSLLSRLKDRVGVNRPIQLLVSAAVQVPTVIGWLRPVVLMPMGVLTGLPSEHVEMLIIHELAHIRRHDYLVNILQGIAEALLFYHPAVWWISAQIRHERELCCDDVVVRVSGDVLTYARALTELESSRKAYLKTALAADGGSLTHRIARLLGQSQQEGRAVSGSEVIMKAVMIGLIVGLAVAATQAQTPGNSQANDNLNEGIRAFRETRYESATAYFREAMRLDPNLIQAELYLGRTYARRYVPRNGTQDNQDYAVNAINAFQDVLKKDANNIGAVTGLAEMYQNSNQLQKARELYIRASQLEPLKAPAFYAIGAIDWILAYDKQQPLTPDDKAQLIEDGLHQVDIALALDPNYEDAMTYKNLLLREKAMQTSEATEKSKLIAQADQWFNKALETRRKNQSQAQSTLTGVAGGPTGRVSDDFVAPPPPPPPPPPPTGAR
jgi:beta-lactamase regulating signal transducer with metallopeptidase domain